MKLNQILFFLILTIGYSHSASFCTPCPTNCDYGTILLLNKIENTCFCHCGPDPCEQKICPEFHLCRVKINPNCLIGYCNIPKIGVCISMPPPKIFFKETAVTLESGSNFNIEPFVEYNGSPRFKWLKDGKELLPANALSFGHVISMVNVNKFNQGIYELILSDEFGFNSAKIEILVSDPATTSQPDEQEIISLYIYQNSVIEIQENFNFNLMCLGSNRDKVSYWHRGSVENLDLMVETSEILKIKKAKYSDSGEYWCRITDGATTDLVKVTIKVKELLPTVARINYEKEIYVNDDLSINCGLSNLENSPVQWYLNEEEIIQNFNLKIDGHKLIINDVDFDLNGELTCIKKLLYDRFIEERTFLNVIDPYPDVVAVNHHVRVNEGDSAHLACNVDCDKKCKITWYDPFGIILDSNEEELILYNVKPVNSGKYTCKASNQFGTSQALIDLIVNEYERNITIEVTPNKLVLYPNDQSLVECKIHNDVDNLITFIKWVREDDEKIPDKFSTTNNFMYIEAVSPDDSGEYLCIAKSKYGKEYYASIYLTVKEIKKNKFPVYLSVKDYLDKEIEPGSEIKFGYQLKLECFSDNTDTIEVTWNKESGINRSKTNKINNQLSILEIPAFTSIDLGKYICSARDSNGTISSNSVDFSFIGKAGNLINFKINGLYGAAPVQTLVKREPPQAMIIGAKEITASKYDWIKIECKAENNENVQFSKLNGVLPDNSYNYKNESYFLILPDVKPKDSGYYECKAINAFGVSSDSILLTVVEEAISEYENENNQIEGNNSNDYYDDEDDEFVFRLSAKKQPKETKKPQVKIFGLKQIVLSEGEKLEIVCQVNYSVNVELIHFGDEDYKDKVTKIDNFYYLKLTNINKSHSGYYTCTAFNDNGIVRDHVYVDVVERKKIMNWNDKPIVEVVGPEKILVNQGESVEISCKIMGADKVHFKNENDPGQNIAHYKIDDLYTANINNVASSGYFICIGENEYGTRSAYVYVTVEYGQKLIEEPVLIQTTRVSSSRQNLSFKKQIPAGWNDIPRVEILGQKKIEKTKGASHEIVCEVKGGQDVEFRSYYETWPDNFETENIGDIYKLKLNNLKEEDSGFYQCFSNNEKGHSFDYIQIIIKGNEDNNIDF